MPPYWDNKALPNLTRYFIFNFLMIAFIFIENKLCDLKREKNLAEKRIRTRVDRINMNSTHVLPSTPLVLMKVIHLL